MLAALWETLCKFGFVGTSKRGCGIAFYFVVIGKSNKKEEIRKSQIHRIGRVD